MDKQANILIVDDELRVVRTLNRLLRPQAHTFLAGSGKEALEILRNNRIHVILSDQRMPEMMGVELLAKVKQLSSNTTRILLTGYSDLTAVTNSVNEGEIFRYITKPWNNKELLEVVDQAVEISLKLFQLVSVSPEAAPDDDKAATILAFDEQGSLKSMLEGLMGKKAQVSSVTTPAAAMERLANHDINIIVTDPGKNNKQYLAFIKVAKANYPSILSVVITEKADSNQLISLINEGQIYRYMTKPVSMGQLKMYLMSALRYQKKLLAQPALAKRHQVQEIKDEEVREIGNSLFKRMRMFFSHA